MPLYEYQCESCEHRFEKIQKYTDPPPAACPECGAAVRKLASSPAIQFKGSGWYITDYAKSGTDSPKASGGKPEAGEKSDAAGKSESKSDTPATKSGGTSAASDSSPKTAEKKADAPAAKADTSTTTKTT